MSNEWNQKFNADYPRDVCWQQLEPWSAASAAPSLDVIESDGCPHRGQKSGLSRVDGPDEIVVEGFGHVVNGEAGLRPTARTNGCESMVLGTPISSRCNYQHVHDRPL